MYAFKRILVGVEESEDALKAFNYAVHRAKLEDSSLIIALVLENEDINTYEILDKTFLKNAREKLIRQGETYRSYAKEQGVTDVEVLIGQGNPGEVIVKEFIPISKADLLIIGSKSRNPIRKYLGTQASYMAKNATISVLVYR